MKTILRIVGALVALTLITGCGSLDSSGNAGGGGKGNHSKSAPSYTASQEQAISAAKNYLSMGSGFSRAGLIDQLSSKAGNGFKMKDAVFAVNHIKVDYNKQAVMAAKAYLSLGTGFSRSSLIDQLTSPAGNKFTVAQATYAANHVGL